jgi:hypothetical protein
MQEKNCSTKSNATGGFLKEFLRSYSAFFKRSQVKKSPRKVVTKKIIEIPVSKVIATSNTWFLIFSSKKNREFPVHIKKLDNQLILQAFKNIHHLRISL